MGKYKIFFTIDDAIYYSNRKAFKENLSEDPETAYLENYRKCTENTINDKLKIFPEIIRE
ncbi:MAG: hypothetical protein KJ646_02135 [Nanoarchaeota archaeon]|nr:hypothetical protein [Nanoarchaeota archaeon]MBU4117094.1 hypothetical protein [Nanoarchaeota archaeon]